MTLKTIIALAIVLGLQTGCPQTLDNLAGTVPTATGLYSYEATRANWIEQRIVFQRKMLNTPSGTVMFLGDSHTEAMSISGMPYAENFGISGESFRMLLFRLNENDISDAPNLIHRAGGVVIETGVNDLANPDNGTSANRAATVEIMIDRLAGWLTGKIIIICPPMVDSTILPETVLTNPANSAIATVNAYYKSKFAGNPNAIVIDINDVVAPNGTLLPQYDIGDGQHLSNAGYSVLKSRIQSARTALGL